MSEDRRNEIIKVMYGKVDTKEHVSKFETLIKRTTRTANQHLGSVPRHV